MRDRLSYELRVSPGRGWVSIPRPGGRTGDARRIRRPIKLLVASGVCVLIACDQKPLESSQPEIISETTIVNNLFEDAGIAWDSVFLLGIDDTIETKWFALSKGNQQSDGAIGAAKNICEQYASEVVGFQQTSDFDFSAFQPPSPLVVYEFQCLSIETRKQSSS